MMKTNQDIVSGFKGHVIPEIRKAFKDRSSIITTYTPDKALAEAWKQWLLKCKQDAIVTKNQLAQLQKMKPWKDDN